MTPLRPFYLNLFQIRLPIGGFVSILHRASGAFLSLSVPSALYVFMLSLESVEGFASVRNFFAGWLGWLIGLGFIWALLHHLFAGLRHLGFDIGWGEEKIRARQTAWLSLVSAVVLSLAFWVLI